MLLREQQKQLDQMKETISRQEHELSELRARSGGTNRVDVLADSGKTGPASAPDQNPQGQGALPPQTDERLGKLEQQAKKTSDAVAKQLGTLSFSGDLRLQYDSIYNQLNPTVNANNPAVLGNNLSSRQRLRLRARLTLRNQLTSQFDVGIRFATGLLDDAISPNKILTDFYNRKQFALDQAWVGWNSKRFPGLRLMGGKFEPPWVHTEMTLDNDINTEGLSEMYSRDFKNGRLKNLSFVAWQMPFLERNSAFVRNANGTVNFEESGRQGRDLALYGAQVRARFGLSPRASLSVSAADNFYSGTQLISPVQFFGNQLLLPVSITIPATATSPAQTITTQVSIPRDFLVAGANLGLSTATNNAVNRDGRLSSGFNLVDLIGRLDITGKRFPVAVIYNYVRNTQAHNVVTAGPDGRDVLLPNNQNTGHWAEVQLGRAREKGDIFLAYTFMRIEKDAVLTPFNFSEIAQQSDVRVNRINFSFTVDPHVVLGINGLFTQRIHGVLGPFGNTPPGSLNTPTSRIQFETLFRF
jgi:hypothetical protein